MGTPEFAVPSLERLLQNRYTISAVVTAPDKPRGRGQILSGTPVKVVAQQHGLPVLHPETLRDPEFLSSLRTYQPDLIVVVAFRILPPEVFTLPRLGSFNLHASLLPKYRGAAPINWAIINGESETGVTTFLLEQKVDTGNILLQRAVPIRPDDDAGTIHDTLSLLGADEVLETVRLLEEGKAVPRRQDSALATPAPKIFKDHCRIVWDSPSARIHNLVRGLSPHPAAFTMLHDAVVKVYRTRLTDRPSRAVPGTLRIDGEVLVAATVDTELAILELQQEGRKRMGAAEFLRGFRGSAGERFV
jgi:methionyl-tRNA formyltransferase